MAKKRARAVVEKPKNYTRHGWRNTRLYEIWASMKGRCRDKGHTDFKYYGAKGIRVCKEWQDFVPFKNWALANGYTDTLTIDRKNSEGNYEPDNCRWVTRDVQTKNRNLKLKELTIFGETKSVVAWLADSRCSISYSALWGRINNGWPVERALTARSGAGRGET